jgi:hypothetical protein
MLGYMVKVAFSLRRRAGAATDFGGGSIHRHETRFRPQDFIKQTAAMTAGLAGLGVFAEVAAATPDTDVNILGPKPGYSPQVGTMVPMLTWMQDAVVRPVQYAS